MSLLWIEGFEIDLNTTDLARKYATFSNTGLLGDVGRWSGLALRGDTFNTVMKTPNLGNKANAIMGCNIKIPSPTANITERIMFALFDGANEQIALYWLTDSNGNIQFRVKRGSTVLATTSNSWNPRFWNLVEFKAVLDTNGSNGEVEVKVNGISELLVQNTDTTNAASLVWNQFQITVTAPASTSFVMDDVYLIDLSGAKNNSWLGEHLIDGWRPTSNGNRNQWSSSSGASHFQDVDEAIINNDADYLFVETTQDNLVELFNITDLSSKATDPVLGVLFEYDLRMDNSGSDNFALIFRNGAGSEAVGSTITINQILDYKKHITILEDDPVAAAAWTVSGFNAFQFGIKSLA